MNNDTDAEQNGERTRRQLFRFDPTVNSGTILQMALLVIGIFGAYSALKEGQATQQVRIEQVESSALAESLRVKESLGEIKGDLKEVQRTVNEINQSLATIKGAAK
ncbi:hypothetical protein [Methylibium sp.]|uniref:hypothetical protein n=1 Tax=Methylibium sp. TaxID=2067992 RepID=UPI0017F691AE|nr:hypothetical protein [Methylibium sp.]MBA3588214.1 hypothetical protein [Methylibium sp.]